MNTTKDSDNQLRRNFIIFLLAAVAIGFLSMILDFLAAVIIAAVFSGLLYPLYSRLRSFLGGRSALAAATVLTVAILAIGLPFVGLVSMVTAEAIQISQQVRPPVQEALASDVPLSERMPEWLPFVEVLKPYSEDIQKKIGEAAMSIGSWLVKHIATATQSTLGVLVSLFVTLYAMFFFLINGPNLLHSVKSLLPLCAEDRDLVMDRGLSVTYASLKGIIVIGAIQGGLVGLGLWVSGINSPVFWGAIVFVLSAIPGVGAPIVWVPAAGYLIATGSVGWGVALAVWGALIVGLADNILRPMLVGRDAKLPDLVILISILGGITSFGAVGIIIGPIIAAILDTVLNIYKRAFAESLPS